MSPEAAHAQAIDDARFYLGDPDTWPVDATDEQAKAWDRFVKVRTAVLSGDGDGDVTDPESMAGGAR